MRPNDIPQDVRITVDDWVGVVDRAIGLVGEDHVSLGSDFDGGPPLPRGMRDVRDLPMITDAMLRRGYSEERIRKFLGGNLLRVYREIEAKADCGRTVGFRSQSAVRRSAAAVFGQTSGLTVEPIDSAIRGLAITLPDDPSFATWHGSWYRPPETGVSVTKP